jgi:hypothetical protein
MRNLKKPILTDFKILNVYKTQNPKRFEIIFKVIPP